MRDAVGDTQTLLVFGGGSEIALATARALVRRHTRRIVLAGRPSPRLEAAERRLLADGAERVERLAFDADDPSAHPRAVEAAFSALGDVDVVLVAFGVLPEQATAEREPELALATGRTNYLGAVSVLTLVAQHMRAQGHGAIVVLSSVAAERARRSNYVYGASKAGLDAFALGLGDALAPSGVRVIVVRPGFVITRMTAGLSRPPLATTPAAVGEVIVGALRGRADLVWAPARLRPLMVVLRHLPGALFRRLSL